MLFIPGSGRCLAGSRVLLMMALSAFGGGEQLVGSDDALWTSSSFCPAYFQPGHPPELRLFPLDGPALTVALPPALSPHSHVIAFSSDGRAVYTQKDPLNRSEGINKIEFQPARESVVPGTIGTGEVWCLESSQPPGTIVVNAWSWSQNTRGIFRIDPTATMQLLPLGSASVCGGEGGLLSPDGERAITRGRKQLRLVTLNTGTVSPIKGTSTDTQCTWSPDGRWIAGIRGGRIVLVNAAKPNRARHLGSAGDAPIVWSPDSKYLLLRKSSLSCALTLYGESLEIVEVTTGRRRMVKSSHCTIIAGTLGWLDRSLAQ